MNPLRDRHVLYAATFMRALGVGMIAVLIGLYPVKLGLAGDRIGLIVSAGLAGVAAAALLATLFADRYGKRRMLVHLAILSCAGGIAAALTSSPLFLGIAAFLGMINGMGQDRGAALIIEQSILPSTTTNVERTDVFARYNVLQDIGHAAGGLLAGLPTVLQRVGGVADVTSFRIAIAVYSGLALASAILYLRLSPTVEATTSPQERKLSPESRRMLIKISSLFALDSLGGGFFTTAMLSVFFTERFGVEDAALALLFMGSRVLNAISHFGAAWLSKRIGLVNTMVFTHIPSSLLFITVAFAPSWTVAAVFFLLREGLVEMDVPTRQSYVMAVVRPEERTFASGITNLVRVGAWTIAPLIVALFVREGGSMVPALLIGVTMKIVYDILLYFACRRTLPPEER